jgi:phospholipase/carboxylesterase
MDLVHASWEPEGDGPFPTLFALHGWGANAMDLLGLAPHLMGGSMLLIAPQGPIRTPIGAGIYGYGWFPIGGGGGTLDRSALEVARKTLEEFLEAAGERYPVDPSRTFALGFSQGGVMACDVALRHPERFAGLILLSSWLPADLARSYLAVPAHSLLPALVQHGSEDPMIPVRRGEESAALLRELGVPVTYSEYPMGHEISAPSLRDLNAWLAGERIA